MRMMRISQSVSSLVLCLVMVGCSSMQLGSATRREDCPPDAWPIGTLCVDRYEGSIWQIDPSRGVLIRKVVEGRASLADLNAGGAQLAQPAAGTGVQLEPGFPQTGNWSMPFYAASVRGVYPTVSITWFQAAQACALSGKRLLTNQEWQIAAAGTLDPGANDGVTNHKCNTGVPHPGLRRPRPTGQAGAPGDKESCISNWKIEDMVGNIGEYVGDWAQRTDLCNARDHSYFFAAPFGEGRDEARIGRAGNICYDGCSSCTACTSDAQCQKGDCGREAKGRCGAPPGEPAAYRRGGDFATGVYSGVFALTVGGDSGLSGGTNAYGFRCARELRR